MDWWLWLAGGLLLLVIELVTPSGFFVMFFGLAALAVGLLAGIGAAGPAWLQWLLFSVLSVLFLLAFRRRLQGLSRAVPRDVDTLVGELVVPKERLLPGAVGPVEARGTTWSGRNDGIRPIEPGTRCRIVRVDGLTLGLEPE